MTPKTTHTLQSNLISSLIRFHRLQGTHSLTKLKKTVADCDQGALNLGCLAHNGVLERRIDINESGSDRDCTWKQQKSVREKEIFDSSVGARNSSSAAAITQLILKVMLLLFLLPPWSKDLSHYLLNYLHFKYKNCCLHSLQPPLL